MPICIDIMSINWKTRAVLVYTQESLLESLCHSSCRFSCLDRLLFFSVTNLHDLVSILHFLNCSVHVIWDQPIVNHLAFNVNENIFFMSLPSAPQSLLFSSHQDVAGKVLDRWAIMTFEEEIATLQQFLRFGETKSIVELMALQDKEGQAVLVPSTRTNSDIRTFIERNTPRTTANLSTPKVDKLGSNSMHHFENFINSMAFMLPFQMLGSAPTPFMGTPTGMLQQQNQNHQPCHRPFQQQSQRQNAHGQDDVGKDNPVSLSHSTESSLLGTNSALFSADLDRTGDKPMDTLSAKTKMEAEDLSASDNYSDGPSTPCTPLMSSEVAQMSPEEKLRSLERNGSTCGGVSGGGVGGSSLKKGRVVCNACEKTFYDKGTLKIHYNAVHLKIKHKCTIEGCNMVFSSLRSRNRHSANPNPRLHMPMNRNNRDKDIRGSLSADESSQGEKRSNYGTPTSICSAESNRSVHSSMLSNVDTSPKLHGSSFPSIGHGGILFPNLKTVQPVLPFYRSLVTPAELANTPGTLPSLPVLSSSVPVKPITAQEPFLTDPVPKKKSRKSSMPIKIERDEQIDKDSDSENDTRMHHKDGDLESMCTVKAWEQVEVNAVEIAFEKERESTKSVLERPSSAELAHREKDDEKVEKRMVTSTENRLRDNHCESISFKDSDKTDEKEDREQTILVHAADRRSEIILDYGEHGSINGDVSSFMDDKDGPDCCLEDYGDSDFSHFDPNIELPHHCEICKKTFKNPYSVKLHYQNVHLKDMHMCTVEGCNAAFPSRRSRDR